MECDKGKKTDEEIENEYIVSYRNFYDNIIQNEMTRARAVRTAHRIDEMMQFFAEEPKVRKLKIWGYDKENMSDNLYKEARQMNAEKLKRAKEGGKFYGDEDDLDIEGD